jgi:tetratricopeptide (TPR) repeat protein
MTEPPGWGAIRQTATSGITIAHTGDGDITVQVGDSALTIEAFQALLVRAAVAAPASVRNTLPRDTSAFTGREAELQELLNAIHGQIGSSHPVLVHAIDGMAGVGKTAFAVHAAHQMASWFPDGQLFLPLHAHTPGQRPVEPADALGALLRETGMDPQQVPASPEERERRWRDQMAGKRILLLLDDAVSHHQVRPLIPGLGSSAVLITSRRRLTGLEDASSLPLDIMPPDQAARLFGHLSGRPDGEPQATANLMKLAGYLPLAVRLLAAQLRHHRSWTVTRIVAELSAAHDRSAAIGATDQPVSAAFALTYNRLSRIRQDFFRCLGLHPGIEIDAYAAAALGGTSLAHARTELDALYTEHLIEEPASGRYRLHDLLADYARALAATDPAAARDAAADRLLEYYQLCAAAAGSHFASRPAHRSVAGRAADRGPDLSTREQAVQWMHAEYGNLIASIMLAARTQPEKAISLDVAVSQYLSEAGHGVQACEAHQAALTAARLLEDRNGEAGCLMRLGTAQIMVDNYAAAIQTFTSSVSLYRELNDVPGLADALTEQAEAQQLAYDDDTIAIKTLREAVGHYRGLGDRWGEARALTQIGGIQTKLSAYDDASEVLIRALALSRELGDLRGQASALNYLSACQYLTGSHVAASATVAEVIKLYRSLGNAFGEAHALMNLGGIQTALSDYRNAAGTLTAALDIYHKRDDRLGQANALTYLSEVQIAIGHYVQATNSLQRALVLYIDIGDRHGEANVYQLLGDIKRRIGDYTSAADKLNQALTIFRQQHMRLGEADVLTIFGDIYGQTGQQAKSSESLKQAMALYNDIGDRRGQADALNQIGALLFTANDTAEAMKQHVKALRLAREINGQLIEADALIGLGKCLGRSGKNHEARAHICLALTIYRRIGSPKAGKAESLLSSVGGES